MIICKVAPFGRSVVKFIYKMPPFNVAEFSVRWHLIANHMPYNKLTNEEKTVIENKGTERPFEGEYDDFYQPGTFICRRCNAPLFTSKAKFDAGCGWPAFDDNFPDAVDRTPDDDGQRTEIRCAHCDAHLGHVFEGEQMTAKDTRHCVNSLSIRFVPEGTELPEILHKS